MRNRIFIVSALAIIVSAAVIRYVWMDSWERPSACACKVVFSPEPSVAIPAARAMVGNAYYEYTLRVARIRCLKAFAAEVPAAAWQDTLKADGAASLRFFQSKCP